MSNILKEIDDAVTKINQDIYESLQEYMDNPYYGALMELSYHCNGAGTVVEFLGINIWSSEDDERKWDEAGNEQESLELFLRSEVKKLLELTKLIELPTQTEQT